MIRDKVQHRDKLLLTFYVKHLNGGAKLDLENKWRTTYDIKFGDITGAYKQYANSKIKEGYSVVFVNEGQSKILIYNNGRNITTQEDLDNMSVALQYKEK